jgi:hypothetical protein
LRRNCSWGVCFYILLFDKDHLSLSILGRPSTFPRRRSTNFHQDIVTFLGLKPRSECLRCLNLSSHGPEKEILCRKCKDWLKGKVVKPDFDRW